MPAEKTLIRALGHFAVFVLGACITWAGYLHLMGPEAAPPFLALPLAVLLACGAVALAVFRKYASPVRMLGMALVLASSISYLYRMSIDATGGSFAGIDLAETVLGFSGVLVAMIGHVPPTQDQGRTDRGSAGSAAR